MQREKVTSTRSIVEMQLIQIFIPTKKVLNLVLEAFNVVPMLFLQVVHWNEPIICCHFPWLPGDLWKTGCLRDAAFFVFPAAKITLKESKKALNALLKLLFCIDNCSTCTEA